MKAIKDLVCKSAFFKPPISLNSKPVFTLKIAYKKVLNVEVAHTLISQLATKVSRLDKINFEILRMI